MQVKWLRRALENLAAQVEYIEQDNPSAASHVFEQIVDAVHQLALHPSMGRPGRVPGTRELVIANTPFLVPYRVKGDTVIVLRVFHGARRWPGVL